MVEIVDERPKIDRLIAEIDAMIGERLVTLEKAQVIHYRHTAKA